MNNIRGRFFGVLSFFWLCASGAYAIPDGQVTTNLMGLFENIGSIFSGICLVIGVGLIFASFIQYRQHRINKLLVPISKPIFMFILGAFLACIPVLGHYTQGGQLIAAQDIR
ncbi:MAG: hypothetical protein LRY67_03755 [Gammaproteobacteria bacterium]|nr:hypothetical protein [Gammaproteobacteria bacterium]